MITKQFTREYTLVYNVHVYTNHLLKAYVTAWEAIGHLQIWPNPLGLPMAIVAGGSASLPTLPENIVFGG